MYWTVLSTLWTTRAWLSINPSMLPAKVTSFQTPWFCWTKSWDSFSFVWTGWPDQQQLTSAAQLKVFRMNKCDHHISQGCLSIKEKGLKNLGLKEGSNPDLWDAHAVAVSKSFSLAELIIILHCMYPSRLIQSASCGKWLGNLISIVLFFPPPHRARCLSSMNN